MLTREALGGSLFMHLSRCKRHLERLAVSLQGNGLIATLEQSVADLEGFSKVDGEVVSWDCGYTNPGKARFVRGNPR
jgi:hypothetical protein